MDELLFIPLIVLFFQKKLFHTFIINSTLLRFQKIYLPGGSSL